MDVAKACVTSTGPASAPSQRRRGSPQVHVCSGWACCLQPAPQARVAWSVGAGCQLPRLHAIKPLDTGHLASAKGSPTQIEGMLHPARAVVLGQSASGRCLSGRHHSADHPPAQRHSPPTAYAYEPVEQGRWMSPPGSMSSRSMQLHAGPGRLHGMVWSQCCCFGRASVSLPLLLQSR